MWQHFFQSFSYFIKMILTVIAYIFLVISPIETIAKWFKDDFKWINYVHHPSADLLKNTYS